MPTESGSTATPAPLPDSRLPLAARRVFRLAAAAAVALTISYALGGGYPYLAPVFAVVFGAQPAPPPGFKGLLGLVLLVSATLSLGLLLVPVMTYYPLAGVLLVAVGIYCSNYLTVNLAKGAVGMFMAAGVTLIPALGTLDFGTALDLVQAMAEGVAYAVLALWIAYPWFPEDPGPAPTPPAVTPVESNWIALRATLIVLPTFLLALINPQLYVALVMKAVALGQQGSVVHLRHAGRELLGSTLLAAGLAVLFWMLLKIWPGLLMYAAWTLLFMIGIGAKMLGVWPSRLPPTFWSNVAITLFILVGPAVADTESGDDPMQRSFTRVSLFMALSLYAWAAVGLLEAWRVHLQRRGAALP